MEGTEEADQLLVDARANTPMQVYHELAFDVGSERLLLQIGSAAALEETVQDREGKLVVVLGRNGKQIEPAAEGVKSRGVVTVDLRDNEARKC